MLRKKTGNFDQTFIQEKLTPRVKMILKKKQGTIDVGKKSRYDYVKYVKRNQELRVVIYTYRLSRDLEIMNPKRSKSVSLDSDSQGFRPKRTTRQSASAVMTQTVNFLNLNALRVSSASAARTQTVKISNLKALRVSSPSSATTTQTVTTQHGV